ncbi:MAG: serine protein kinase [Bdellovibrionaceae bacterium]|nr:serine protein kinase [Pseudobdellovibrionaceae bacterium]
MDDQHSSNTMLKKLDESIQSQFQKNKRVLSFQEYLYWLAESPQSQLRGSSQYIVDMMDHYGKEQVESEFKSEIKQTYRFHLFDLPVDGIAPKVVGHETVQTKIYQALKNFNRLGMNNKLLLLHGPNGSAKSTIVHALMAGLERYSKTDEGALYTFNWIFPIESLTRGKIGLNRYSDESTGTLETYAHLTDEAISAKIPSEMKDHPILLIPSEQRQEALIHLLGEEKGVNLWKKLPLYLKQGDLSHRCKEIFEALLSSYQGDYQKILKHIQVERFYYARRYRKGLVTIEPQMHVDAHYSQLTIDKSISSLPSALQGMNFFSIRGDLVEGNRGMIEFSDLLKRPVESYKYLLTACETGSVNVGSTIAYLDTLFIGSSNELQLDAFKDFPDFPSFKARMELVRVPYLLNYKKEQEIFELLLPQIAGEKPIAPHTAWMIALWSTLTRLKKPNTMNYPSSVSSLISSFSPLEKANLYAKGSVPSRFTPEERKKIKSSIHLVKAEYSNIPYYEGRTGASVREMKAVLFDAAHRNEFSHLSPMAVLRELETFVKRTSEFDFLKQEVKDGYHDMKGFISIVQEEYLNIIDREVKDSIGLYDTQQWEDFIKNYVIHASHLLKKEKMSHPITGRPQDPDSSLIEEFETIVGAPKKSDELKRFRQNIISQIGAWSLENKNTQVSYSKIFPEYWEKLEQHYFESQKELLIKMNKSLHIYDKRSTSDEGAILAQKTVENMVTQFNYNEESAAEVISFLIKNRYNG